MNSPSHWSTKPVALVETMRIGLLLLGLISLALLIYRPWLSLPFDIWDFQEFLPLLKVGTNPLDRLQRLTAYYATHGRLNIAFYASFVSQWELFGMSPTGWQWWRFTVMSADLLLVFILLRKLSFSILTTSIATGLLVASTPVQRVWVQLMAESQAVLFLLGGTLLAIGYQHSRRWKLRAVLISLLLLLTFLSKEIVGVMGLLVVLTALARQADGTIGWPEVSPRNIVLLVMAACVAVLVGTALLWVRALPQAAGYSMNYGTGPLTLARFIGNLVMVTLPHHTPRNLQLGLVYPANVCFFVLLALGWYNRLRRIGSTARQTRLQFISILLIPIIGASVYLPWGKWDSFYGMPFFLGSVFLVAGALDEFERRRSWERASAYAMAILVVLYSTLTAQQSLAIANANLKLNTMAATWIAASEPSATIVFLGDTAGTRSLPVKGSELKGYAYAVGLTSSRTTLPRVLDAECAAVPWLASGGAGVVVLASYSYACGRLPTPDKSLVSKFTYRDWLTLTKVTGQLSLDFLTVGGAPP